MLPYFRAAERRNHIGWGVSPTHTRSENPMLLPSLLRAPKGSDITANCGLISRSYIDPGQTPSA